MRRAHFVRLSAGAVCTGAAGVRAALPGLALEARLRPGARLSSVQLLDSYPAGASGDVVQYELGFGAAYDKQIGFGHETNGVDHLYFVETQVGNGDHACNPNTLKKIYLKRRRFANVFTPYPASVYVTRSGSMMTRWGDGVGPSAADVLLLDTKLLYRPDPLTIESVTHEVVTAGRQRIVTTRVAGRYADDGSPRVRELEVWLSPHVPLGVVRMRAAVPGLEPFGLTLYAFARTFKTSLALKLDAVRALTPSGGEIPVMQ